MFQSGLYCTYKDAYIHAGIHPLRSYRCVHAPDTELENSHVLLSAVQSLPDPAQLHEDTIAHDTSPACRTQSYTDTILREGTLHLP